MQQGFRSPTLVPRGSVVESAVCDDAGALIAVRHANIRTKAAGGKPIIIYISNVNAPLLINARRDRLLESTITTALSA